MSLLGRTLLQMQSLIVWCTQHIAWTLKENHCGKRKSNIFDFNRSLHSANVLPFGVGRLQRRGSICRNGGQFGRNKHNHCKCLKNRINYALDLPKMNLSQSGDVLGLQNGSEKCSDTLFQASSFSKISYRDSSSNSSSLYPQC